MSPLDAYPFTHAFGWTLLHFCWQGAAVALLLWCVLGAIGTRSSQLRYVASCAALALLVILPLITFLHLAVENYRAAVLARAPVIVTDFFVNAVAGASPSPWPVRLAAILDQAMPWLLVIWCAGVACLFARLTLGLFAARTLRTSGTRVSAELQELIVHLQARLGISRIVQLLHSTLVDVPTVIGWLRPVVLLPASCVTGLAPAQLEALLCHELAHIRRHDYLVSILQSVVETLLFYHPAVWWVSRQVRRERECCCDEFAVRAGGDVLAYARALSYLEEQRSFVPQLALGANGGVLKMRIQRLLGRPNNSNASKPAFIAVLGIVALFLLGFAARHVWAEVRLVQAAPAQVPARTSVAPVASPAPPLKAIDASEAPVVTPRSFPDQNASSTSQETAPRKVISDGTLDFLTSQLQDMSGRLEGQQKAYEALLARERDGQRLSLNELKRLEDARRTLDQSRSQWNALLAKLNSAEILEHLRRVQGAAAETNTPAFLRQMEMAAKAQISVPAAPAQEPSAPQNPPNTRVAVGVMQGMLLTHVNPAYPQIAKDAHVQGTVVLHAAISKEGRIVGLNIVSGPPMLMKSAMDAVQQWTYKPYLLNGEPVAVDTTIHVNFSLGGGLSQEQDPIPPTDAAGLPVRRIGGFISPPIVIHQVEPEFTLEARKAKFMGTVVVGCIVNENGLPEDVHVVRGIGMGLNDKAIEAVKQYKFKPATENGEPVPVELNIEVNFQVF